MAFRQSPGSSPPTDINDININESGSTKQPGKCLNIIGGRSSGPLVVFDFNFLIAFCTVLVSIPAGSYRYPKSKPS